MSATHPQSTGTVRVLETPRWYTGRGELVMVVGTLALSGLVAWGTATMEIPPDTPFPGPDFFPWMVAGLLGVLGIWLGIDVLGSARRVHLAAEAHELSPDMLENLGSIDQTTEIRVIDPEAVVARADAADGDLAQKDSQVDVKTVLLTLAGLIVFTVILPVVGWIVSAAALFWFMARIFGSTRPLFDVAVAVILSSVVQLAFGAGLGLPLPGGFLEGAFSWIS